MLVNFRFKNSRSFYEEAHLSMQASNDTSLRTVNVFTPEDNRLNASKKDLLKSALIFGPNASGKSNVLKAMDYMKFKVLNSSSSQNAVNRKNEPFIFFYDSPNEESIYEVEIVQNKTFYRYGFKIKEEKITSEWLDTMLERSVSLFKRTGSKVKIKDLNASQTNFLDIPDNTLFLSIGNSLNTPIKNNIHDVLTWFSNLLIIFDAKENCLNIYNKKDSYIGKALDVLKKADTGVNSLEYKETKIGDGGLDNFNLAIQKMMNSGAPNGEIYGDQNGIYDIDLITRYNIFDNNDNQNVVNTKDIYLLNNSGFNSEGTRRLLMYLGYIVETLDNGGVVLLDEIDSRLHFLVSDYLIKMFNSIDENPNNAQLIATAHNTMLMDDGLRRDQIYFTTKDKCGTSSLLALSDFKDVRKTDLYSKKYLAGFYTKLPDFHRGI